MLDQWRQMADIWMTKFDRSILLFYVPTLHVKCVMTLTSMWTFDFLVRSTPSMNHHNYIILYLLSYSAMLHIRSWSIIMMWKVSFDLKFSWLLGLISSFQNSHISLKKQLFKPQRLLCNHILMKEKFKIASIDLLKWHKY